MAVIYNKDGDEVIIDDSQMDEWLKLGYSIENPLNAPSKPNDFEPIVMFKDGKEKAIDTQKAYDKAIKEGWAIKENEN